MFVVTTKCAVTLRRLKSSYWLNTLHIGTLCSAVLFVHQCAPYNPRVYTYLYMYLGCKTTIHEFGFDVNGNCNLNLDCLI